MRYLQSKSESNELLRLVLPKIAQWGSGCHPPSYTLWYEYVAGHNSELSKVLDERLSQGTPLSLEETHRLYGRYVVDRDMVATNDLQGELERTLGHLAQMASHAGEEARAYGASLQDCGEQLEEHLDVDAVRHLVQALAAETRRMQASNEKLKAELETKGSELRDISGKLDRVRSEAMLDPLTGLSNRRALQMRVDDSLTGAGLGGWSLLMVDIDHFKKVNDTHGHLLGDRVLQAVARVMKGCIKGRDMAVRFGGEEFAILLPDTSSSGAMTLAETIRRTVCSGAIRRSDGGVIGNVTVSIGVAAYKAAETLEHWIERADQALYASKQSGRNRVTLASV